MPVTATPSPGPIGPNIRRCREAKGITQVSLSHAIGHTGDDAASYISRLENNRIEPHLSTLQRIAEALGVGVEMLILGDGNGKKANGRKTGGKK